MEIRIAVIESLGCLLILPGQLNVSRIVVKLRQVINRSGVGIVLLKSHLITVF